MSRRTGRAVDVIPAVIASIRDETPTVKRLVFDLGGRPFDFLPGQWIDCYLHPGPDAPVAGYSMTSPPRDTSTIEIAVKRVGGNPVTDYIHGLARAGDTLPIDGGYGDFSYDPSREPETGPAVALIAGGIGITPLMSMLRAAAEAPRSPELTLVYSAVEPGRARLPRRHRPHRGEQPPHLGPLHHHPPRRRLDRPPRAHRPRHAARPRPRPPDALLRLRPRAVRHRRRRGRLGPRRAPLPRPLRTLELAPG